MLVRHEAGGPSALVASTADRWDATARTLVDEAEPVDGARSRWTEHGCSFAT